jgi:hypothetical protein
MGSLISPNLKRDGICNTRAIDEQSTQDFSREAGREETPRDLVVNAKIILKWISEKEVMRMWAGFNSFRTGTSGGLLWTAH